MSYREKAAWAGFVSWLVVWGFYFVMLARTLASGGSQADLFTNVGIICTSLSVLPIAWLQRRASKRELARADERERTVEMRSAQIAYRAVIALVIVAAALALVTNRALTGVTLAEPGHSIFNAVLLLVVLAELARFATQIILFRRGGA